MTIFGMTGEKMAEKDYILRESVCLTDFEIAMCNGDYKELCKMIVDKIANAPAADVQTVVRGEWIADGDGYHWTYNCSICGWKDGYPFNERHNFCPNCGAKMRKR